MVGCEPATAGPRGLARWRKESASTIILRQTVYIMFRALDFDSNRFLSRNLCNFTLKASNVGKYRTVRIVGKRNLGISCKREIFDLGQHTFVNSWLHLQEEDQNLFGETIVERGEVIKAYSKIVEVAKAAWLIL